MGRLPRTLDGIDPAYRAARGRNRRLLAKIALRPSAHWFGAWDTDATAADLARQYIRASTRGRPDALTQVAVFRLEPWEQPACSQLPTATQQASYKTWIDNFAAGIGDSRVALILQPDLPFASCAPGGSLLPLQLVAYAAQVFSSLPHTTVYIDGGARDWDPVSKAVWLLENAGVAYTRGFALNNTHYDSTGAELTFGAAVARGLARAGIPNMHFVINTAENGAPFMRYKYRGNKLNPAVCAQPPRAHLRDPRDPAHLAHRPGPLEAVDPAAAPRRAVRRRLSVDRATLAAGRRLSVRLAGARWAWLPPLRSEP